MLPRPKFSPSKIIANAHDRMTVLVQKAMQKLGYSGWIVKNTIRRGICSIARAIERFCDGIVWYIADGLTAVVKISGKIAGAIQSAGKQLLGALSARCQSLASTVKTRCGKIVQRIKEDGSASIAMVFSLVIGIWLKIRRGAFYIQNAVSQACSSVAQAFEKNCNAIAQAVERTIMGGVRTVSAILSKSVNMASKTLAAMKSTVQSGFTACMKKSAALKFAIMESVQARRQAIVEAKKRAAERKQACIETITARYWNLHGASMATLVLMMVLIGFSALQIMDHQSARAGQSAPPRVFQVTMKPVDQTERSSAIFRTASVDAMNMDRTAWLLNRIQPAAGDSNASPIGAQNRSLGEERNTNERYEIPQDVPEVETVLVPQKNTVISSSRDGKIVAVNFENGELFQKGDVLIEYDCRDLKAEMQARESEESLQRKKALRSSKLLKLEIISDIENLTLDTEQKKAEAQKEALEQRVDSCFIRADYDGRVTNRLANPGEYTRTDRVLMEVSSLDDLEAEFLVPSQWLRWLNIGAPVDIEVSETGVVYKGRIVRIHGEVDPASQSIQMTAKLDPYDDPLLPGMSGRLDINVDRIRAEGILGFLETQRAR